MKSLPRSISVDALRLVSAIFHDFKQNRQWINENALRNKISSKTLDELSKEYEHALFKKQQTGLEFRYELTLLGFIQCEDAKNDIELLEQTLEFLKNQYVRDPDNRYITAEIVRYALKLDKDQIDRLGVSLSILVHGSDDIKTRNWYIETPQDIELLVRGMTAKEYILNRAEERYLFDQFT